MSRYRPGEVGYRPNLPVSSLLHRILNVAFETHNMSLHSSPCKLNHSGLFTPSRYLKVPEKPVNGVKGLVSAAIPPQTNETLLARRCFGWRGRRGEAVSWSLTAQRGGDKLSAGGSWPAAGARFGSAETCFLASHPGLGLCSCPNTCHSFLLQYCSLSQCSRADTSLSLASDWPSSLQSKIPILPWLSHSWGIVQR